MTYMTVLLMLLLVGWPGMACSQALTVDVEEEAQDSSRSDCPQWQDLGMENVLAVAQPTVSVPTTLRFLSFGSAMAEGGFVEMQHRFHPNGIAFLSPFCPQSGYLYFLRCLRL